MFYYLDSSHLIKCVCFYISNLFTALPQDALSPLSVTVLSDSFTCLVLGFFSTSH